MNLIKFKDIIKPGDDLFNTHLKGKWAWWVHMKYVVPMDQLDQRGYVQAEMNPCTLRGRIFWDSVIDDTLEAYIDLEETNRAGAADSYIKTNELVSAPGLSLADIKNFRTWLAATLLDLDAEDGIQKEVLYDPKTTHMLEFYKNGMYDSTMKWLGAFWTGPSYQMPTKLSSCGCVTSSISSVLNAVVTGNCDHISPYKQGIHAHMVSTFANISFWASLPTGVLERIKEYIDSILQAGLGFTDRSLKITDCACSSQPDKMQEMLRKLSDAFRSIIDDDICGSKNYITSVLKEWADYIYEHMQWT